MQRLGWWVDLQSTKLFDAGQHAGWLQAFPYGTYTHPVHGQIDLTPERAQRFASNIKTNVRGQDLDIDYDHKDQSGKAAGWVKDAEARSDGLWIFVDWTPDAATSIGKKEYRYFSPEFQDEWEHPGTKQKHQDVMFGGALTNRPFLKGILPINLSELVEGGKVDPLQEMRKLLGLGDDADEAAILAGMQSLKDKKDPPTDPPDPDPSKDKKDPPVNEPDPTKEPVAASEAEVKKLMETPFVKELFERTARLEAANRLNETTIKLNELQSDHKVVLAPAQFDEVRSLVASVPTEIGDKLLGFTKAVLEGKGTVELGERGHSRTTDPSEESAGKTFAEKVQKYVEENKGVTYADAAEIVARGNEKEFYDYTTDTIKAFDRGQNGGGS